MDKPGFIVPPPGLIPPRPEQTIPGVTPAAIPAFVPSPIGARRQAAPARPETPPPSWRLVLPDGGSIAVTGSVLLGRDPAALPGHPRATRLPVNDPARSVSKTHAIVNVDGAGCFVTDLHSTNGVIVTDPDGTRTDLEAGSRAELHAGSRLRLGEFLVDVRFD